MAASFENSPHFRSRWAWSRSYHAIGNSCQRLWPHFKQMKLTHKSQRSIPLRSSLAQAVHLRIFIGISSEKDFDSKTYDKNPILRKF